MSNNDRSSFLLRDFEPASARLKRKLRLLLNESIRKDHISSKHVTMIHFMFYIIFFISVWMICRINRNSEDIFNADRSIRRLLMKVLSLNAVKTIDQFWNYLDRFNQELYRNVRSWQGSLPDDSDNGVKYQFLILGENFILGIPRLRQLRVDHTHCRIPVELHAESAHCYAPYEKSREYRDSIIIADDHQYTYTSSKETKALSLFNVFGPYSTGGFIYSFSPKRSINNAYLSELKNNQWINISTRAVFLELIYYNPNTDLLTSINILFEFLTTGTTCSLIIEHEDVTLHVYSHLGTIETQDFFYTVPLNGYFYGRNKVLGVFQILSIISYVIFVFYFVSKIAQYRLWFIVSSYWNVYDFGLIILFSISIYFDVLFLLNVSEANKSLSRLDIDVFNELIPFIQIQVTRNNLQAYLSAATLIHLLRFLPHFSNLLGNLLNVFYKSIRNSIGFLLLFFLIFMSFVFFATLFYGDELEEFHTFTLTSFTLIRCALGQFEYDRAYRISPVWTPIFYMVYVCVVYFILLNLFVAVVNETYVLGKQEQQQIEDDLREEFMRTSNTEDLTAFRRSQRPALQMALIQCLNRLFRFIFHRSFDINDDMTVKTFERDDDDDISLTEKRMIIVERLRRILLSTGHEKHIVEKFFERLESKNIDDDDEDEKIFFLNMSEERAIDVLEREFQIFNNQYTKLAEDWQRTVKEAQEKLFANTIDKEQATIVKEHLIKLEENIKRLEILIPKALDNCVQLYRFRFPSN